MDIKTEPYTEETITTYDFTFLGSSQFNCSLLQGVDTMERTPAAFILTQPASKETGRTTTEVTVIQKGQLLWHTVRTRVVKRPLAGLPTDAPSTAPVRTHLHTH